MTIILLLALLSIFIGFHHYTLKKLANHEINTLKAEVNLKSKELLLLKDQLLQCRETKPIKKYEKSLLTTKQAKIYKKKLLQIMTQKKPYLDNDITLVSLSEITNIPQKELSQVINQEFDINFSHFINRYRVEEAKKLLSNSLKNKNLSILDIAFNVGFNSKSSFNMVFKNHTRLTPSAYKKEILPQQLLLAS